jgi:GR25 family glycosyltransferase involved in LPS biosynthesis
MIEACVISLDDKNGEKRLNNFKRNVQASLNFEIKLFKASKHERGGTYGNWDSHMQVLKKSFLMGFDYVLIFEDDAITTENFSLDNFKNVIKNIETLPKDWDLLGLGGISACWSSAPQKISNLFYQGAFFETHSYVASKKFMKSIFDMQYEGQVDYAFARRTFSTSYMTEKELFTQDDSMGSHNKLQQMIIPFRSSFKLMNRKLMKLQLKIRNIAFCVVFLCALYHCSRGIIIFGFMVITLLDCVLDPSFAFRSNTICLN